MYKLLTDCRYGKFLVPDHDIYVGEALATYGEYSQTELELLLQFVTKSTRVVAVGANLGALVIPLAIHAGEVVAFEPQRFVFHLLTANVALNELLNVRTYWAAVGMRKGVVQVPILDPSKENNFGGLDLEAVQGHGGDVVQVWQLDNLPNMDMGMLTIDVEGMEEDVLRGGERTIARCRPVVFFEADRHLKRRGCFDLMRSWNYDLYWYRTKLFNPDNFKAVKEDRWAQPDGGYVITENVLATPKERAVQLSGFTPVLEA